MRRDSIFQVCIRGTVLAGLFGLCLASVSLTSGEDKSTPLITGPRLFAPSRTPIRAQDESRTKSAPIRSALTNPELVDTVRELRAETTRLKRLLQAMELDRLRALYNAIPAEEANALRDSIWANHTIEVTWENPEAAPEEERKWVRDAVEATWQAESGLRFTNWGKSESGSRGIRIRIADVGPHCKRLGNKLDGLPDGMVLNFTFQNWCTQCGGVSGDNRKFSIMAIAAHEFGHAIGFAHEQNRTDAPPLCQNERQGGNGDWYVTLYDPESIMNYCSTDWNNNGKLSDLDKVAVQTLYGLPRTPMPLAAPKK